MTNGSTGIGSCVIKEKQNSGDGAKCVELELNQDTELLPQ